MLAQNRDVWDSMCVTTPPELVHQRAFYCNGCKRSFRTAQDMSRHRCDSIRSRHQQVVTGTLVVCPNCHRTFRQPQDMTRHKCTVAVSGF